MDDRHGRQSDEEVDLGMCGASGFGFTQASSRSLFLARERFLKFARFLTIVTTRL
jgi:hypothetical protein